MTSQIAASGNSAIQPMPILQHDEALNIFTANPDVNRKARLYKEIPSMPVRIIGNSGASYGFKSCRIKTGVRMDAIPRIELTNND